MEFKVFKTCEDAKLPVRADLGAAGYDLTSVVDMVLSVGERRLVPTGLIIQIPSGTYARIGPRSGMSVKGIDIGAGIVDFSFRGEVKVLMINNGLSYYELKKGDRIAQLILERIMTPEVTEVKSLDELTTTQRGEGGFGSTGK
jgi:dUTP pyrophosphatase